MGKEKDKKDEGEVMNLILKRAKEMESEKIEYLLDASKLISRLLYLNNQRNIDLYVIHLVILYGCAWFPGLIKFYGKTFSPDATISAVIGMYFLMTGIIILIDNYVDESVLTLLSKKRKDVKVIIYTRKITEKLRLDAKKFNSQYGNLVIEHFTKSHDRFLKIDKELYHFGASLKDLGKRWFAFSRMNPEILTGHWTSSDEIFKAVNL